MTTFNAAFIAHSEHLIATAEGNQIGPRRFDQMQALRTAADALLYAAEMLAEGRGMDDPEVSLYRKVAEAKVSEAEAVRAA